MKRHERRPERASYESIDAYLEGTGTTQQQLADKLRISQGALSMIKSGLRIPRPKLALRIHEMTGIPLDTVLRGAAGKGVAAS